MILTVFFLILIVILSFLGSLFSLKLANHFQILDKPSSNPDRKNQLIPVPLVGSTGFVLVCTIATALLWLGFKYNLVNFPALIYPFRLIWVLVGIWILFIVGLLDDLAIIKPIWYFCGVFVAILVAVFGGSLRIEVLSYPFNSVNFTQINLPFLGLIWNFDLSQILAFLWISLCLCATKFVDGSDGLCSIIGIISLLTISSTSLLPSVGQPLIAVFALVWVGGLIGFLPFNFPNAQSYLGDGGSTIIGFVIGVLSILGGAKVATVGTVLGWFILDIILVMIVRISLGQSILKGDNKLHWHHRLAGFGFSKLQILIFTTIILLFSSHFGLYLSTVFKFWLILFQLIILTLIFAFRK